MRITQSAYPTPYPDVNQLVDTLLSSIRTILGDQFVGMYLHGSLALGDFDPRRSDVDYLVVTESALPPATVAAAVNRARGVSRWRRGAAFCLLLRIL